MIVGKWSRYHVHRCHLHEQLIYTELIYLRRITGCDIANLPFPASLYNILHCIHPHPSASIQRNNSCPTFTLDSGPPTILLWTLLAIHFAFVTYVRKGVVDKKIKFQVSGSSRRPASPLDWASTSRTPKSPVVQTKRSRRKNNETRRSDDSDQQESRLDQKPAGQQAQISSATTLLWRCNLIRCCPPVDHPSPIPGTEG
jgi:hypothetical protein